MRTAIPVSVILGLGLTVLASGGASARVTLQSRMSDEAHRHQIAEFLSIAENLSRLSADLREGSLSIRMIPLSEIFVGFNRPVHDLARELGKEIRLVMRGGETELDKNIVDRLKEPLIHLIRNAADHGLETAEERLAAGKPREGLIRLEAEQAGSTVLLRIVDDGKGLDRARILEKAVEKGILSARDDISDIEVFSAIFEPGFSTARHTTAISGRGVGMDVVRRTVEELGGRVELASRLGVGTTVTLSIPLTLAIIDGFMVESAGERFVVNLSQVRECLAYTASEELGASFRLVSIQGELIPCADLTRLLGLKRKDTVSHSAPRSQSASQLLICQLGLDRYGFLVDRIIGQHQTVIKALSKRENRFGVLSGATILGNGTVALILDVARLVQHSQSLVRTRSLHSGTRAIAKTLVPALD